MKTTPHDRGDAVRTLWLEIARRLEAWLTESEGDPPPADEVFRNVEALARAVLVLEPSWSIRLDPFLAALDTMHATNSIKGTRSLRFDKAWDGRSQAATEILAFIRTTSDTTLATLQGEPGLLYIATLKEEGHGETILWWKPRGAGYTTRLDEAGQYTAEEARAAAHERSNVALPCAEVDALAVRVVAHHHLETLRTRAPRVWAVDR